MERQTITVDIAPGAYAEQRLRVSQGDIGRPLGVYVTQNGEVMSLSGHVATLYVAKPDGNYYTKLCTISGNLITWDTAEQETPLAGELQAQIRITKSGVNVGTARFVEYVEQSAMDGYTPSESDISVFQQLATAAASSAAAAENAQEATEQIVSTYEQIPSKVSTLESNVETLQSDVETLQNNVETLGTKTDKLEALVIDCGTVSSLPKTVTDTNIEDDMVVLNSVLGTPSAQTGDWTVTTSAGSLTVSGTISGSTTLKLYLMKSR